MTDYDRLPYPRPLSIIGFDKTQMLDDPTVIEGLEDLISAIYVYINPNCTSQERQIWTNEQHKILKRIRSRALIVRHEAMKTFERKNDLMTGVYGIMAKVNVSKKLKEKMKDDNE